jgi:hypothetical protein
MGNVGTQGKVGGEMKTYKLVYIVYIAYIACWYWWGVFSGHFSHQVWTNSNPDTFIHGALAFTPGLLAADITRWWRKRRKFTGFDDVPDGGGGAKKPQEEK